MTYAYVVAAEVTGPGGTQTLNGTMHFPKPATDDDIRSQLQLDAARRGLGMRMLIRVDRLNVTPL